jgi:hypothetical protein
MNVKHMALKRKLNLHIEVEGLGFGHYNIHVNFELRVKARIGQLFGLSHL